MVALLKQKPTNYPALLAKIDGQAQELHDQIAAIRKRIAEAHVELDAVQDSPKEHREKLADLSVAIREAEASVTGQEELNGLLLGAAGQEELDARRARLVALKKQRETVERAHLKMLKENEKRAEELHAAIEQDNQQIATLDARLRATWDARGQAVAGYGAAIKAEQDARLTEAEQLERECTAKLEQARRVVAQIRQEARDQLAEWPMIRRDLEESHKLTEDATTEGLSAFLALARILLTRGPAIENAAAGCPPGVVSMVGEMELDAALLRALGSGDTSPMRARYERVEYLLRQYRASLAMV